MQIARVNQAERADFLSLVNAEIRPDHAISAVEEDFPLILGSQNSDFQLICRTPEGRIAGCIACLIRDFQTSCGVISIAGIGSVVTHPDFRGKGISSALQIEMLELLKGKKVPLAVLWTDQPEIYSGRGFRTAGWEIHAQLEGLTSGNTQRTGLRIRDFLPADVAAVEELYFQHPLRTLRQPGDSQALYTMPGTQGLVLVDSEDLVQAAIFCGKGADFQQYITEWAGSPDLVLDLFRAARDRGLARQVLIPAGAEGLVNQLVDLGGSWFSLPSGCWSILDPIFLANLVRQSGQDPPTEPDDPVAWLGSIDEQGQPLVGPLTVAVWGFDSV